MKTATGPLLLLSLCVGACSGAATDSMDPNAAKGGATAGFVTTNAPGGVPLGNASAAPGATAGAPQQGNPAAAGADAAGQGAGDAPAVGPTGCGSVAATSQLRRLTKDQYDNTIADLLGLTSLTASGNVRPSSLLEPDHAGSMTALGWSSYQTVAEQIATQVMGDPELKRNFVSCDEAVYGCLSDTIVDFGRRAFRRPLTEKEIAAFETLIQSAPSTTPTGAASEAAELLLFGFLVSPVFLVRSETHEDVMDPDGNYVLSSHEVASRLSYLLWGSMPDSPLREAAEANALQTKEQILTQAERMLSDDRAHQRIAAFHRSYLGIADNTRWDTTTHDPELYPSFNPELNQALSQEVEAFFDHVTYDGGSFQDLLLSSTGFVNAEIAALYDLDATGLGQQLGPTSLDPVQRPGFLTRLGFLNAYSEYNRPSPILRGAFIVKEVLGLDLGAPPPGATDEPLPAQSEELNTNRKRVEAQTSGLSCAGCHQVYINPLGFALENFDAIGRYRDVESNGAPIDAQADVNINGSTPVTVSSPFELMTEIAKSAAAQRHYAERWTAFAYERGANVFDACLVDEMGAKMTAGGYTILQLVTDLTQADSFRLRRVEN